MPEGFNELPASLQVLATMFAAVIAMSLAFFSVTKKWLDKVGAGPAKPTSNPTDAVVISGAFADGQPIRELTHEIERLRTSVDSMVECSRNSTSNTWKLIEGQNELNAHIAELNRLMRAGNDR